MMELERTVDEMDPTTPGEPELVLVEDVPAEATESPFDAAARMLELASATAERLVGDAEAQAASLVATAQTSAEALADASRDESERVSAELARTREEQVAELERERAEALDGLAEEKVALEAQIASLRAAESDQRHLMRQHLTQHLSMLEASESEPQDVVAG